MSYYHSFVHPRVFCNFEKETSITYYNKFIIEAHIADLLRNTRYCQGRIWYRIKPLVKIVNDVSHYLFSQKSSIINI